MPQTVSVRITDHSDEVLAELEKRAKVALEAVGIQAEGHCKQELENIPKRVDTGLLRNSITHAYAGEPPAISSYHSDSTHGSTDSTKKRGIAGTPVKPITSGTYSGSAPVEINPTVYVGTNVEYGPYVEMGTDRMAANHFIKNGCQNNKDEYIGIMKKYLEG